MRAGWWKLYITANHKPSFWGRVFYTNNRNIQTGKGSRLTDKGKDSL